ncbi:MAG TPA: multiprotein bridging factor aMBF1 [Candidatus Nanoarchaeia archaeon]|nr:multiprotein bridging factor aMBF1 [Candidatus Nanoarchaeia archaeon]
MVCELCGKNTQLVRAIVEGTEVNVCENCGKYGKVLRKPVVKSTPKPAIQEVLDVVTQDYAKLIREAREKRGLTQKEFAKELNEKESILQKIENGNFVPPISMARKLEKLLKIKLVELEEEEKQQAAKGKSEMLTIGDVIKTKL